ncbi:MAG: peptidylprolyl isomerase [Candidatus Tenebribacter davisii]|nr:peptidylprolyl isomerase [Candidatus Tenebribacter davisii]
MKYIMVLIMFLCSIFVSAKTIAEIGDCSITSAEYQQEIDRLDDKYHYSYENLKRQALSNLIDNCLISNYATEKRIYVDDTELEAFFIQQVGDLPRFQTNGEFSERKFHYFKNSKEGRNVLKAMRKELRITKAKTILEESFELNDEKVLKQYFMENTKIDLGYTIIDKQDIDYETDTTPDNFYWYYRLHKHEYDKEEKIKLNLFVVLNENFRETVKATVNREITKMIMADSTLNAENTTDLREELLKEEIRNIARQKALQITELLQAGANTSQPIIASSYLSKNDKLGDLPDIILKSAFELAEGKFSEPINIGTGFLVFEVVDKKKFPVKDEKVIANTIWRDYISKENRQRSKSHYRQYFEDNFENFIIPVVVVTKVEISRPPLFSSTSKVEYQQKLKNLLERNKDDEYQITQIVKEYNLTEIKENIYLEKFENSNLVNDMISIRMNRGEEYGFIPIDNKYIFYKAITYFPEFIPSFKRIYEQLPKFIANSIEDSTKLINYYDAHNKDFRTPDSLQIGGVIFSVQKEFNQLNINISDSELKQIYDARVNDLFRERSVKYNYIFIQNHELAETISEQLSEGSDPSLIKLLFGTQNSLPENTVTAYDKLPEKINSALSNLDSGSWSLPVNYDNGWIILHKIKGYKAGISSFSKMKKDLLNEKLESIADSITYNEARAVFDSTRYFSQLSKYVEKTDIFRTEFQDAKKDFRILGDISDFRTELLRMWNNEKYSGIVKLDNAYAVIFQIKINRSTQLTYGEAIPQITEILNSKKLFEFAKANVSKIKDQIADGANPDSLLYYLGGWNIIADLSLTSKIPDVDFSEAIFEDILKHEENYCSSVIPINSEKLLFYKLLKLRRPSKTDFYSERKYYEKKLLQKEFEKWKNGYKIKIGVHLK